MITCPGCNGKGFLEGFGCPGFKPITIQCDLCKGSKHISDEQSQWVEHGKRLREARIAIYRTMREEAKLRGMKPTEWCDVERGKVDNLKYE